MFEGESIKELLQEHEDMLKEVREILKDEELGEKCDDIYLLRFLLSHKKAKVASEAVKRDLKYRRENAEWLNGETEPYSDELRTHFRVNTAHSTLDGSPIMFVNGADIFKAISMEKDQVALQAKFVPWITYVKEVSEHGG